MAYGFDIAREVQAALEEAAAETGNGQPYKALLIQESAGGGPEWDPGAGVKTEIEVTILDTPKVSREAGSSIARWDRILKIARMGQVLDPARWEDYGTPDGSVVVEPRVYDHIRIRGVEYSVAEVKMVAPGGVVILWEVRVDI